MLGILYITYHWVSQTISIIASTTVYCTTSCNYHWFRLYFCCYHQDLFVDNRTKSPHMVGEKPNWLVVTGTWISWISIQLGISASSQLTNSNLFQGKSHTIPLNQHFPMGFPSVFLWFSYGSYDRFIQPCLRRTSLSVPSRSTTRNWPIPSGNLT